MILGEICTLNEIYGHARYQHDFVVPFLILEIAAEILKSFPHVKYYGYDTYFGGSQSMRHFKRRFLFMPHQVRWMLRSPPLPARSPVPTRRYTPVESSPQPMMAEPGLPQEVDSVVRVRGGRPSL